MPKKLIGLRIDTELLEYLTERAKKENRTLSNMIVSILLNEKIVKRGKWERMSDEPEDDRYRCSCCKNVVHYKNEVNLYEFNSWCGRCGSCNNSLMSKYF